MHSANPPQAAPIGMDSADPFQMQFYKLAAHDIIERAKQFSHCDAASINAFPLRLLIMDGWWPQHNAGITKLFWEDHRNWQSALKKKARNYVTQRYQWDSQNHPEINAKIAKDLLANSGRFLKNGTDDQGRTNNLAHPALVGLIIDFFYTSPNTVGTLFPKVFTNEVPRVAVAISATALKVTLNEVVCGRGEVNFKVNVY
ncbi:hypothetical protein HYDPIDRAFT_35056 [Hydnomerulius pinastri MD-312]|uniref:DUF6532 domain-containing protein n=1 Tax=Hydnomerulius pinastri MD-312 TaxID=994086 RepID=A0A0C2PWL9_9AGAM|nr:hypothetical protein HYDPIDRAFT_35056 [Hydnomerulius pinastri MD-312]